jgi:hypothetical protein
MGYEPLATLLLGWLLGILQPAIVERIRKNYRRAELTVAIKSELHEMQYKMALVSHMLNIHLATATDAHLVWLGSIISNYTGPMRDDSLSEKLSAFQAMPEKARHEELARGRNPHAPPAVLQYSVPFITAHLADIALYPVPFQAAILRITHHLDMFNQTVTYRQKLHDKTFDASLSAVSRAAVLSNFEHGCRLLATQAKLIADAIASLPDVK